MYVCKCDEREGVGTLCVQECVCVSEYVYVCKCDEREGE